MQRKSLLTLLGLLGTLLLSGAALAADAASMVNAPGIFTLTNLHPDITNRRLYSTNYQQDYLLPVCTQVEITKLSKKKMMFRVKDTGVEYEYLWAKKSTPTGLSENIEKYFGPTCPKAEIAKLGKADQNGIKSGQPSIGMTRRGIVLAMGYPPEHITPNLEQDLWMYWRNKFARRSVKFGGSGKVDEIR